MAKGIKRSNGETPSSPGKSPITKKHKYRIEHPLKTPLKESFNGDHFEEDLVLIPLPPKIPSPFAKDKCNLTDTVERHLQGYGSTVQDFFRRWYDVDISTIREEILKANENQHFVWADPNDRGYITLTDTLKVYEPSGRSKIIQFTRGVRNRGVYWFAKIEAGMPIKINGYNFNRSQEVIAGPMPSFSIIEYGDRAVFVYLDRAAVDYTPVDDVIVTKELEKAIGRALQSKSGDAGNRYQSKRKAIANQHAADKGPSAIMREKAMANAWKETARKANELAAQQKKDADEAEWIRSRKQQAEWAEAAARESARKEEAAQKRQELFKNLGPCEFLEKKLKEWLKIQQRFPKILERPVPRANGDSGEWLEDTHVHRAIASITTAIELYNDVPFANLTEVAAQLARSDVVGHWSAIPTDFFGVGQELLMPWNDNIVGGGTHWILLRVRQTDASNNPEITSYDSMYGQRDEKHITTFQETVKNLHWAGHGNRRVNFTVKEASTSSQGNGWACGYHTILNAWCLAMGMEPNPTFGGFGSRTGNLVDIINLAMVGLIDSETILAFLLCTGFVKEDSVCADDRTFSRTVSFHTEASLRHYIQERRRMEDQSDIPRIRPEVIRHILKYGGFGAYDEKDVVLNLERYYQWLSNSGITGTGDLMSPLSPVSPFTIELALQNAIKAKVGGMPVLLPDNIRELKQIFDIYRGLLRSNGVLQDTRRERRIQKLAGGQSSGSVEDVLPSPLYRTPVYSALSRLGMLPTNFPLGV